MELISSVVVDSGNEDHAEKGNTLPDSPVWKKPTDQDCGKLEIEAVGGGETFGDSVSSTPELPSPDIVYVSGDNDVGIGKVPTIGMEKDEELAGEEEDHPMPASSPPVTVNSLLEIPQISTLTEV